MKKNLPNSKYTNLFENNSFKPHTIKRIFFAIILNLSMISMVYSQNLIYETTKYVFRNDLFSFIESERKLGIKGDASKGKITVEMLVKDTDRLLPESAMIYGVESTVNSPLTNIDSSFRAHRWTIQNDSLIREGARKSTNYKSCALYALKKPSNMHDPRSREPSVKVIVRLTLTNVSFVDFFSVDIPGIPTLYPVDFIGDLAIAVYRSSFYGNESHIFYFDTAQTAQKGPIKLLAGDSVVFFAEEEFTISNLPEVWIARTAGEVKYYCTPSVRPGEYRPFLGFDSQVHSVALRKHPDSTNKKIPEVEYHEHSGVHSWYWIAQRRMDPKKTNYTSNLPPNMLQKEKYSANLGNDGFLVGGKKVPSQRNNQREGYNMQLLHAWQDKQYQEYQGQNYVLGLDSDEIIYLNSPYAEVDSLNQPNALLKVDVEEWKIVPEDEGDPIAELVTAYQRNRSYLDNINSADVPHYEGYEIEDDSIYIYPFSTTNDQSFNGKPKVEYNFIDGKAYNNNKAPGIITFSSNGDSLNLQILVGVPLRIDGGFYGSLSGDQWPAEWQKDVKYTLQGLKGVSPEILKGLSMEYSWEDELGILTKDTRYYENSDSVNSSDKWEEYFDIGGWGYHDITVYFQRKEGARRVPIAGKELLEVNTRFTSVPGRYYADFSLSPLEGIDIKEGRGDGKYWYLLDYNDDLSNHGTQFGDRDYSLSREYTFQKGEEVTFTCMDSDPHTFDHYDVEFYLSERTMAKRLTSPQMDERLKWYVTDYEYTDEVGKYMGSGRNFSHTWNEPGMYKLTVDYQGSKMSHQINIVNRAYDTADMVNSTKGTINIYDLSPGQMDWLNEEGHSVTNNYRIAKVEQIFSQYTYIDGPRASHSNSKHRPNRFAFENDFNADFIWKKGATNIQKTLIHNPRLNWFPSSWIRHYSDGMIPNDMNTSLVGGVKTKDSDWTNVLNGVIPTDRPEQWQWRLPWISKTPWSGYRTRSNIKVVIDMKALFNNESGAFSGKGNTKYQNNDLGYKNAVSNAIPKFTGLEKSKYDFYLDLESGRKLVFDPDINLDLKVYNLDSSKTKEYFIAGSPSTSSTFLRGADMSTVNNLLDGGIKWTRNGVEVAPYDLLSEYGGNVVRFRLWIHPKYGDDTAYYPYCTKEDVLRGIRKAQKKGLQVILNLQYSNTWTDPSQNLMPSSWPLDNINYPYSSIANRIGQYTRDILDYLNQENALPNYVQIGNETNSNLLMTQPYENYREDSNSDNIAPAFRAEISNVSGLTNVNLTMDDVYKVNWDRNALLLNAGLRAVKQDYPQIKTILHLSGPSNAEWWVNQAFNANAPDRRGVAIVDKDKVDIVGMTYFNGNKDQQQTFSQLSGIIERIKANHGKDVLIVETAFPRTWGYSDNMDNLFGIDTRGSWPETVSPTKQKEWLISLRLNLRNTYGSIGFVYWEPFWVGSDSIRTKDFVGSNWENMTFFGFADGIPTSQNPLDLDGGIIALCEGGCDALSNSAARISQEEEIKLVDEATPSSFLTYPVPAKNLLNIHIPEDIVIDAFQVVDLAGKRQTINLVYVDGLLQVNIAELSAGTYIAKIYHNNGVTNSRFFKVE
ncbi:MAG: glycosyl hydrolase 53 family protein [Bacteroidota bacterium]